MGKESKPGSLVIPREFEPSRRYAEAEASGAARPRLDRSGREWSEYLCTYLHYRRYTHRQTVYHIGII